MGRGLAPPLCSRLEKSCKQTAPRPMARGRGRGRGTDGDPPLPCNKDGDPLSFYLLGAMEAPSSPTFILYIIM